MIRLPGNRLIIRFLRRDHRSPNSMRVMLLRRQHAGMSQPPADKLNVGARIQMPDGKRMPERMRRSLVRERLCLLCRSQQPRNTLPPIRSRRIKRPFAGPKPVIAAVLLPLELQLPKLRFHKIRNRNIHPILCLLLENAQRPTLGRLPGN